MWDRYLLKLSGSSFGATAVLNPDLCGILGLVHTGQKFVYGLASLNNQSPEPCRSPLGDLSSSYQLAGYYPRQKQRTGRGRAVERDGREVGEKGNGGGETKLHIHSSL